MNQAFFNNPQPKERELLLVEGGENDFNGGAEMKVVTSEKPLKVACVFDQNDMQTLKFRANLLKSDKLVQDFRQLSIEETKGEILPIGKLIISQCPGKKIEKGRDGKKHDRDIYRDVEYFKAKSGVAMIVCLLNDSELRSLGLRV